MAGKDEDAVKLFVGQIPRTMTEQEAREYFLEFGPIWELSILKDKVTGLSKGCGFLTYCTRQSALDCIAACHEKRTFPGMSHSMQIKVADSDKQAEECRIFVGMIPKTYGEDQLRELFIPFGNIVEVFIMKDPQGISKGCGFVKMSSRPASQKAIEKLHNSVTLEGSRSPIVVKYADNDRERQNRRGQALGLPLGMLGMPVIGMRPGLPFPGMMGSMLAMQGRMPMGMPPRPMAASFPPAAPVAVPRPPVPVAPPSFPTSNPTPQQASALAAYYASLAAAGGAQTPVAAPAPAPAPAADPMAAYYAAYGAQQQQQQQSQPQAFDLSSAYASVQQYNGGYGTQPYAQQSTTGAVRGQSHAEGPEGSNLFIYHIPSDFDDNALYSLFYQFGNVLSANVFIDRNTNQNKGFGFISYDNPQAAANAIMTMNGYEIGGKRLRVMIKRPKNASGAPY